MTHGFVRAADGTITSFDAPGAGIATFPVAIAPQRSIVGWYFDPNFGAHIFLRAIDGNFTTIDALNATLSFFEGTSPTSINDSGTVTGFYFDTTHNSDLRVFLRAANGTFSIVYSIGYGWLYGSRVRKFTGGKAIHLHKVQNGSVAALAVPKKSAT